MTPSTATPAPANTAMKLVIATPPTCRHAPFGDSSTVRAASSRAGVLARFAWPLATSRITHGPTRLSTAIVPPKANASMPRITIAVGATCSTDITPNASATTTTPITRRTQCRRGASWRVRTPSGEITTCRRPSTALSAASAAIPNGTATSIGHGSSTPDAPSGWPRNSMSPSSGTTARYTTTPATAPTAASTADSITASAETAAGVAPSSRSVASRSSRRRAESRAAAPPSETSGTTSSARAITASAW